MVLADKQNDTKKNKYFTYLPGSPHSVNRLEFWCAWWYHACIHTSNFVLIGYGVSACDSLMVTWSGWLVLWQHIDSCTKRHECIAMSYSVIQCSRIPEPQLRGTRQRELAFCFEACKSLTAFLIHLGMCGCALGPSEASVQTATSPWRSKEWRKRKLINKGRNIKTNVLWDSWSYDFMLDTTTTTSTFTAIIMTTTTMTTITRLSWVSEYDDDSRYYHCHFHYYTTTTTSTFTAIIMTVSSINCNRCRHLDLAVSCLPAAPAWVKVNRLGWLLAGVIHSTSQG